MGTKRSVLTDEKGLPLAVLLSGANTHDVKLLEETLDHIVVLRPQPDEEHPQNFCLDAGYTGCKDKVQERGYIPHIQPRGEEKKELERNPDFRARCWVVEVTHSFFNRFRKLLVRFERKPPIILLLFSSPALLLSGVTLSVFIFNFGICS